MSKENEQDKLDIEKNRLANTNLEERKDMEKLEVTASQSNDVRVFFEKMYGKEPKDWDKLLVTFTAHDLVIFTTAFLRTQPIITVHDIIDNHNQSKQQAVTDDEIEKIAEGHLDGFGFGKPKEQSNEYEIALLNRIAGMKFMQDKLTNKQ